MVEDGRWMVVTTRESYADLVRHELGAAYADDPE